MGHPLGQPGRHARERPRDNREPISLAGSGRFPPWEREAAGRTVRTHANPGANVEHARRRSRGSSPSRRHRTRRLEFWNVETRFERGRVYQTPRAANEAGPRLRLARPWYSRARSSSSTSCQYFCWSTTTCRSAGATSGSPWRAMFSMAGGNPGLLASCSSPPSWTSPGGR